MDFQTPTLVTGVVTQGRPTTSEDWVETFKIQYGNNQTDLATMKHGNETDIVRNCNVLVITKLCLLDSTVGVATETEKSFPTSFHNHCFEPSNMAITRCVNRRDYCQSILKKGKEQKNVFDTMVV